MRQKLVGVLLLILLGIAVAFGAGAALGGPAPQQVAPSGAYTG